MNDMNLEKKELSSELDALDATHLKQVMEGSTPPFCDLALEDKMIQGVYKHLEEAEKETPVIDLHAGMRRSRGSFAIIVKMVAGIAAVLIMAISGYRSLFPNMEAVADCEGKNLLTCLTQQTSDEEIYNYLMQEYSGAEDVYLFESVNTTPSDQIPVELQ